MSQSQPNLPDTAATQAHCDACGMQTNSPELLIKRRSPFSFRQKRICQTCMLNSAKHAQRATWGIWIFFGLVILIFSIGTGRYDAVGIYLRTIAILVLIAPVSILIHELGHALVALAVGWNVYSLVLGGGKPLWQGRLGNTLLQLRLIQIGGLACCYPRKFGFWLRLQAFLMILGGPLANLLASIVGLLLYAFTEPETLLSNVLGNWVFLNLLLFALNLIPYKTQVFGVPMGSDGMQLLRILFTPRSYRERLEYSREISRFATLRLMGKHLQARDVIAQMVEEKPDDLMALMNLSAAEYDLGNNKASMAHAQRGLDLIQQGAMPHPIIKTAAPHLQVKFFEAGLKDNLASAMLEMPDCDVSAALQLAREVYETLPWMPEVQATYGYALGLAGSPAEGLQLLQKCLPKLQEQPRLLQERIREKISKIAALASEPETCTAEASAVQMEPARASKPLA